MATFYRFQNEAPRPGETVHCFRSLQALKDFASMMRYQDPEFFRMKFWEVEGIFIKDDEEDTVVRVHSVKPLQL